MRSKQLALIMYFCIQWAAAPLAAQARKYYTTAVEWHSSIVLCEFESATIASEGTLNQRYQTIAARVYVSRVLKDAGALGLKPGRYDIAIPRSGSGVSVQQYPAWVGKELEPGRTYLVLSDAGGDMSSVIADPTSAELVPEKVDMVGDVELILNSTALPLASQAERAAEALRQPELHSSRMAEYVAYLIGAGADSETAPLRASLDGEGAMEFADQAKLALLGYLRTNTIIQGRSAENLFHALANLTVRYFIAEPEEPASRGRPERMATAILATHLPSIRRSPVGLAALRAVHLTPADAERLKSKADAFASDSRLTADWRSQARDLGTLLAMK